MSHVSGGHISSPQRKLWATIMSSALRTGVCLILNLRKVNFANQIISNRQ